MNERIDSDRCPTWAARGLLAIVLGFGGATVLAEEAPEADSPGAASNDAVAGGAPTKSGYDRLPEFGGPASVGSLLKEADELRKPLIRSGALDDFFRPWFDMKGRTRESIGLSFGFEYTAVYQVASASLGDDHAAGGVFQVPLQWELVGRGTDHAGSLVLKLWNRHELGTDIPPASLGTAVGSATPTAFGFADTGWGMVQLMWQQFFSGGEAAILVGQLQPIAYLDSYPLVNPLTGFLNQAFGWSPTMAFPSSGLGIAGGSMLGDNAYFVASLSDANGSTNRVGFDSFFDDREYFTHLELGWVPRFEDRKVRNIHMDVWHTDARDKPGTPEGWGVTASASWDFECGWSPFLRGGWSTGSAAPLRATVSAGTGYRVPGRDDLAAFGLSYGDPTGEGRRDQFTAEAFYRLQFAKNVVLTPDIQWILNPADNPGHDDIWLFALRLRLTF